MANTNTYLMGFSAIVQLLPDTWVARIGSAGGPESKPWDLITATTRSGSLANAMILAREGEAPRVVSNPDRPLSDAGVDRYSQRAEPMPRWLVVCGGAAFFLPELPIRVVPVTGANALPVEVHIAVHLGTEPAFAGAAETFLSVVGPLSRFPSLDEVIAPGQTVVAKDMATHPHWVDLAYDRGGAPWRQRLLWSEQGKFIVRYQHPAAQTAEGERLLEAAKQIAGDVAEMGR